MERERPDYDDGGVTVDYRSSVIAAAEDSRRDTARCTGELPGGRRCYFDALEGGLCAGHEGGSFDRAALAAHQLAHGCEMRREDGGTARYQPRPLDDGIALFKHRPKGDRLAGDSAKPSQPLTREVYLESLGESGLTPGEAQDACDSLDYGEVGAQAQGYPGLLVDPRPEDAAEQASIEAAHSIQVRSDCPECGAAGERTGRERKGQHYRCPRQECRAMWGFDGGMTYHHTSAAVQALITKGGDSDSVLRDGTRADRGGEPGGSGSEGRGAGEGGRRSSGGEGGAAPAAGVDGAQEQRRATPEPAGARAKPRRRARPLDDVHPGPRELIDADYLDGTVQLSNKACPRYYTGRGRRDSSNAKLAMPSSPCGCPAGRCWYNEQLERRGKVKLALTPEAWRALIDGKAVD